MKTNYFRLQEQYSAPNKWIKNQKLFDASHNIHACNVSCTFFTRVFLASPSSPYINIAHALCFYACAFERYDQIASQLGVHLKTQLYLERERENTKTLGFQFKRVYFCLQKWPLFTSQYGHLPSAFQVQAQSVIISTVRYFN